MKMVHSLDDELSRVRTWLQTQGYPLEMRVAHFFRDRGLTVEQAFWYDDKETKKHREIDVVADMWFADPAIKANAAVVIEFAIECKSTTAKPWVAFTAPPRQRLSLLADYAVVDLFSHDAMLRARVNNIPIPELLRPTGTRAHGLVRAHSENKSGDPTATYAALQAAINAAWALGRQNAEHTNTTGENGIPVVYIVTPLIVIEGSLMQFSLDSAGEETLSKVPWIPFEMPSSAAYGTAVGWVATLESLDRFYDELVAPCRSFMAELLPMAEDVRSALLGRVKRVGPEVALR